MKRQTALVSATLTFLALTALALSTAHPAMDAGGRTVALAQISDATPTATVTPTPTARWCPTLTPEPFWVDPVTSPTDLLEQTIRVHIGNGEAVTVTLESGVFTTTGSFNAYSNPALVDVTLLPNTRHNLLVAARVRSWYLWEGCTIGGYTLWTTYDRNHQPLVIEQRSAAQPCYMPMLLR